MIRPWRFFAVVLVAAGLVILPVALGPAVLRNPLVAVPLLLVVGVLGFGVGIAAATTPPPEKEEPS